MTAKHIKSGVFYNEWVFDTQEELEAAIKKEARVCGDKIRGDTIFNDTIFNHHLQSVRWRGKVKTHSDKRNERNPTCHPKQS